MWGHHHHDNALPPRRALPDLLRGTAFRATPDELALLTELARWAEAVYFEPEETAANPATPAYVRDILARTAALRETLLAALDNPDVETHICVSTPSAETQGCVSTPSKSTSPPRFTREAAIEHIRAFVAEVRAAGVALRKVILFGSYARNEQHEWSDIDLALIADTFGNSLSDTDQLAPLL